MRGPRSMNAHFVGWLRQRLSSGPHLKPTEYPARLSLALRVLRFGVLSASGSRRHHCQTKGQGMMIPAISHFQPCHTLSNSIRSALGRSGHAIPCLGFCQARHQTVRNAIKSFIVSRMMDIQVAREPHHKACKFFSHEARLRLCRAVPLCGGVLPGTQLVHAASSRGP